MIQRDRVHAIQCYHCPLSNHQFPPPLLEGFDWVDPRHASEANGREFGHGQQAGWKDSRAAAVLSFDYCFLSDGADITTDEEFIAAADGAVKVLVVVVRAEPCGSRSGHRRRGV